MLIRPNTETFSIDSIEGLERDLAHMNNVELLDKFKLVFIKLGEYKPQNEDEKWDIYNTSSIIKEIHSHIDTGNKQELMSSYSKLQVVYKNAPKEDKIKILQECDLIRKRLGKK